MSESKDFFDFCSGLHQDAETIYGTDIHDIIDGALLFVKQGRLAALRDYLNGLLTGDLSDVQLQEIYRATYVDFGPRDGRGVREFLTLVRDQIDKRLSKRAR